ncbi:LysR family transcriptional regulator [Siccirubricoccus deserti]|uniref:LysR family transcriptional regulator n=1 Tax=Siccirubricoccus deserti TaxID=2013562 RepID=A0A9X0UJP9_9PROT|nr:LysR family transcriptional regulator [Siccirubricoccus deserti]MBC4018325.1 LysR family transcriptional regulator [Siccirubricoccus deserti]GGC55051.1 LysR family transcriptional regulator [Siccirubricoccus deserti]
MDRLDELRLFLAILDTGSLAAAGRRLGHSPPAVTRALGGLEGRLGVRLLDRSTRRSHPTEAGRRLAVQARQLIADYEAAMAMAAGEATAPRGRLRVAAPLVFGRLHVAPLVSAFLDTQPLVSAELTLADRNADLLEEEIDVAVRIGPLEEASLVARRVGWVRRVLAASPGYLARHGTPDGPAALAGHAVIHFGAPGAPVPEWRFATAAGAMQTVRVTPRFAVNQAEAAVEAAIDGRGIVRALSYQAAAGFADGRLVRLLRGWEPPPQPVSLVVPSARLLPPRVRAFLDFAAPRLAALAVVQEG